MNTRINFKTKVGDRECNLYIDCDVDFWDLSFRNNKFVEFFAHNVFIDEKHSDKDYKKVFEVTSDGDYHSVVEFKNNLKEIRMFMQLYHYSGPPCQIKIIGE